MKELNDDIDLAKSIVKTLLYYDIFSYPLRAEEVYCYLDRNSVTPEDVSDELKRLSDDGMIYRFGEFFTVQENNTLIDRRLRGNKTAGQSMLTAMRMAKLIAKFPFVRAVMASGSLSKGYMDENSDVDFFIITAAKRVWIPRMLLVLYKRMFLKNSHKQFCVNYFLDEDHLEIEEKNIFTATELATVLPLYNKSLYFNLIQQNDKWLRKFFPNYRIRSVQHVIPESTPASKRLLEKLINLLGGSLFEKLFMQITLKYWKKRYVKSLSKEDFEIAFKSRSYVSKGHPNNFQKKVMNILAAKISAFRFQKQESEI